MTRRFCKSLIQCSVLTASWLSVFVLLVFSAANHPVNAAGSPAAYQRPATDDVVRAIYESYVPFANDLKRDFAQALDVIDRSHLQAAKNNGIRFKIIDFSEAQLMEHTRGLPPGTIYGARCIYYALNIQIDLLDRLLDLKNPEKAKALKEARKKRRIFGPKERIFNDYRDHYFAMLIMTKRDFMKIYKELGLNTPPEQPYPYHLKNTKEVFDYLRVEMNQLKRYAQKLETSLK